MKEEKQEEEKNLNESFDVGDVDEILQEEEQESQEILSKKELRRRNKKYFNLSILAGIIIVLLSISLVFLVIYTKYYKLNGKEEQLLREEQEFIEKVEDFNEYVNGVKESLYGILNSYGVGGGLSTEEKEISKDFSVKEGRFESYLNNKKISFVEKKKSLKESIEDSFEYMADAREKINKLKSDIGKYGFLPEEVDSILKDSSIQRSILSIESMKYFTAVKVFSYLDNVLADFVDEQGYGNTSKVVEGIKQRIKDYEEKNILESAISTYLQKCYLNPYEVSDKCQTYNDFSYDYGDELKDEKFFKNFLSFINERLETSVPKLSIVLNSLNPQTNRISFGIQINTFKEDQADLQEAKENILNPHIFISSTLINLLRGSHFILGETIDIESLEKTVKTVDYAGEEKVVNTSNFSFDVPIQKPVEREVYDFVYGN